MKLTDPVEINAALEALKGHSASIWAYRSRCRHLSFWVFGPHRCFLLMKAHHISCTHLVRDGGAIRVAVNPTDGRAMLTTLDGGLGITGEQLLLNDDRAPPLHPSSSFVMKVIHEDRRRVLLPLLPAGGGGTVLRARGRTSSRRRALQPKRLAVPPGIAVDSSEPHEIDRLLRSWPQHSATVWESLSRRA